MKDERLRNTPRPEEHSPARPSRELAELKATALLSRAGFAKPPVDVEECARAAGIAMVMRSDLGVGSRDDTSAVLMQRGEVLTALINARQSPARQRFSLAHEIGHWVLERTPSSSELAPIASRSRRYNELERICDYFAASLLMPRRWMQQFVAEGRTAGELAKLFDVSMPAMSARMRELDLATQRGRLK